MQAAARPASWRGLELTLLFTAIFLFALLVRLSVIGTTVGIHTAASAEPTSDSRIHMMLVENLLAGRGYSLDTPTSITPPLYVFFLTGLYRVTGSPAVVRLIQAALGAGGCALLYAIGKKLFGHNSGLMAALLLSVYPVPAYLSGLHVTENLFLFLLVLIMWQALAVAERPTTRAVVVLGVLMGLAALTRAIFLTFLPFALLWTMTIWGPRARKTYAVFAIIAAVAAAVISPWTIRNYVVLGTIVPVQSNGGMVFWAGNNPYADGGMSWPTAKTWTATRPPDDSMYGWRNLSLSEENSLYMRTALQWILDNPGAYVQLLGKKLVRLYGMSRAADDQSLRVPLFIWIAQVGFLAAAVSGIVMARKAWRRLAFPLALILFVNVTTLVFSGATRYAAPMSPSLALFAGFALALWWYQINHRD